MSWASASHEHAVIWTAGAGGAPHSRVRQQAATRTETQSRGCPHEHAVTWTAGAGGAPHSR